MALRFFLTTVADPFFAYISTLSTPVFFCRGVGKGEEERSRPPPDIAVLLVSKLLKNYKGLVKPRFIS